MRLLQTSGGFGEYTVDSTMTLTDAEIAEGYVGVFLPSTGRFSAGVTLRTG